MSYINIKEQNFSYIGQGPKLKGDFIFTGTTKISCELEGELKIEGEASLCFDRTSSVKANVICHDLEIFGNFVGNIESTGIVKLYPSSSFEGSLKAKHMEIHPGARVNTTAHTI
jgi:cytoskeletal protein CcmA (bactofilin family)